MFKIKHIVIFVLISMASSGCIATHALYEAGERYYNIINIKEAHLLDNNKLILFVERQITYHDSTYGFDNKVIGLDLEQTGKTVSGPFKIVKTNKRSFKGINFDNLLIAKDLQVYDTRLFNHVIFSPSTSDINVSRPLSIFKDEDLLSLNDIFIFKDNKRFNLIRYSGNNVNIVYLTIDDAVFKQPIWAPIKIVVYPLTFALDTVLFPFEAFYAISTFNVTTK